MRAYVSVCACICTYGVRACMCVVRSMEVQLTDFENAAFTVFVVLVTRVVLAFDLALYTPLSKVGTHTIYDDVAIGYKHTLEKRVKIVEKVICL